MKGRGCEVEDEEVKGRRVKYRGVHTLCIVI